MFRINLFLKLNIFFKTLFINLENKYILKRINRIFLKQSKKKRIIFTNQCRVAFLFLLKYLKIKYKEKNEIIFVSYNLAEMVNVAKNLNFKIKFIDLNYKSGNIDINNLNSSINKKTCAVVLTNMFNDYQLTKKIKYITKKNKINLIEDNAIYFDNYTKKNKNKIYSGQSGDYSIYSFNIMKHISAFYGGAIATNDIKFYNYLSEESKKLINFPKIKLFKQILIFFILKIMSINFLYKLVFIHIIKFAHIQNVKFILALFYPSLRFKKYPFNYSYFSSISNLSLQSILYQVENKDERMKNFLDRKKKNIYYQKKFKLFKSKKISLIPIKDFNYQNFIDFPLLVQNKESLNKFLLKKGFEIRYIYYKNCEKIFKPNSKKCINSQKYEDELICLPNHRKINFSYIDDLIQNIKVFYSSK